jgi:hypothetical protein
MKRNEILSEILKGASYGAIMGLGKDPREKGFIYETLAIILLSAKQLIPEYDEILDGHLEQTLIPIEDLRKVLNTSLAQGDNPSDVTLMISGILVAWSVKYRDNQGNKETDIDKLSRRLMVQKTKKGLKNEPQIGLIVKDKAELTEHKGHKANKMKKDDIQRIRDNGHLLDEEDVKMAFKRFQGILLGHASLNKSDDVIEWMNATYIGCPRIHLRLRLHQALARDKFLKNLFRGHLRHVLSHKPRSGKSLTMLCIAKKLLDSGRKRILIATPVPETIKQFVKELHKYIEFKGMEYKRQDDFMEVENAFCGIIFCSTQYFKTGKTVDKRAKLEDLGIDAAIFDESHYSTSTFKTYVEMIHSCHNESMVQIFASGTSRKTEEFYKVPSECIYRWGVEDEICMKSNSFSELVDTHGDIFKRLLESGGYNSDYSRCPVQVLMREGIDEQLIQEMDVYNEENGSDKGYTCASMLALVQKKRSKKGATKFKNEFQLSTNSKGERMLTKFLNSIISSDPQCTDDIITQIEETQSEHSSRRSTVADPKLFLMFLPYGPKIGSIQAIQKTLVKFLKDNDLWTEYHICYSNSKDNSSESDSSYIERIDTFMTETRNKEKKGCILLLGSQGSLGISYPDCDVTISLDNGNNLDDAKQRYYRALMEASGKTIGINVDLNIQRCWMHQKEVIRTYRNKPNVPQDPVALLEYLYKKRIYYFDPLNRRLRSKVNRIDYFGESVRKMRSEIEVDTIVDSIICKDDLREIINEVDVHADKINPDIQGLQPDCNPGGDDKVEVDVPKDIVDEHQDINQGSPDEAVEPIIGFDRNRTKELYGDLAVTTCLLSIWDRRNPDNSEVSSVDLIRSLVDDDCRYSLIKTRMTGRYGVPQTHINNIYERFIEAMKRDTNQHIIDDIIDIYSGTSPTKLREAIATHFTPSEDEKKNHAEIPTPCALVDEMLDTLPREYFQSVNATLEPCCGKGNFVLGIFERFFEGMSHIEDKIERCRIIIESCIFFTDIEAMNVHITKHLLMCHAIASISGDDSSWGDWDKVTEIMGFNYNTNVGDTLLLDPSSKWNVDKFESVIGNPPYQKKSSSGASCHGKTNLWTKFIEYAFSFMNESGYLLYITPSSWMGGTVSCYKDMITRQIHHLNVNECKRHFPKIGSTFSYYLIQNTQISSPTKIICNHNSHTITSSILLSGDMKILPQYLNDDVFNILNKVCKWGKDKKFIRKDLIRDKPDTSSEKKGDYSCPVITFVRTNGTPDIQYCKYDLPTKAHKKVLLFRCGYLNPFYDDGQNAVGNNIHYCTVDSQEQGERLRDLYKSDVYTFIFSVCRTSSYTNGRVMNWLHRDDPSYEDIYTYLGLNDKEKRLIMDYNESN